MKNKFPLNNFQQIKYYLFSKIIKWLQPCWSQPMRLSGRV